MIRKDSLRFGFLNWLHLDVIVPAGMIVIIFWPLKVIMEPQEHWFERVFASADSLLLAAILLAALCTEIEANRRYHGIDTTSLEHIRFISSTLSKFMLVIYGFCKLQYLNYDFIHSTDGSYILNIAWLSLLSLIAIVIGVIAVRLYLMNERKKEEV